jgi:hypothetical protein
MIDRQGFASPPLKKGATGDLLLLLLQKKTPLNPPFSKGEDKQ